MTVGVLDNGTRIDESHDAVFFTKDQGVKKKFITIHWWGDTRDRNVVIATFCNGGKETSAHFIVEAGYVGCVVNPDDIAWACGNWEGNLTSISIECNPRGSDGDYAEIAALIRYLRAIYGDLPLVPHRHWVATQCPGTYDLNRLERLSRAVPTQEVTMADVTTNADRLDRYGRPDGAKTNVLLEAQWRKANDDVIKDVIRDEVKKAKDEILAAIKAK